MEKMSKDDIFADPMLEDDESLLEYVEQLNSLNTQGKLPDLEEEMCYKVYSIRGSSFGDHESIVLTTNDKDFVTVELGFHKMQDGKHIYPVSRTLDSRLKPKLKYRGEVTMSGKKLVAHAVSTMRKFGGYFKYTKNCQHFCNSYLVSIGLSEATSMTDDQKVMMGVSSVAVGTALVGLVAVITKLLQRIRANKN